MGLQVFSGSSSSLTLTRQCWTVLGRMVVYYGGPAPGMASKLGWSSALQVAASGKKRLKFRLSC